MTGHEVISNARCCHHEHSIPNRRKWFMSAPDIAGSFVAEAVRKALFYRRAPRRGHAPLAVAF